MSMTEAKGERQAAPTVVTVIKAAAAVLALLAPLGQVTGVIDIPPTLSTLMSVAAFTVSIAVIVAIVLLGKDIARIPPRRAAISVLGTVLLGCAVMACYVTFASKHVVNDRSSGRMVKIVTPIAPSGELAKIMKHWNYDYYLALNPEQNTRASETRQMIDEQSLWSVVLMLVLMVAAQAMLLSAIVGGAWRAAEALRETGKQLG